MLLMVIYKVILIVIASLGGEALDSLGRLMKAYSLDGTEPLPSIPAPKEEKPVVKQERMFDDDMSSPSSPAESDISSTSSKPTGRRSKSHYFLIVLLLAELY